MGELKPVSRRNGMLHRVVMIVSAAVVLTGCSFILSEDDEYRYRKIDYPVGEKQKIR